MNHSLSSEREMTGFEARLDAACVEVASPIEGGMWFPCSDERASSCAKTILLVEDESFVCEVTCEVLQSAGYQVWIARNAADATDIYKERGSKVDLLLTDVILPGETGRALAATLRRASPRLRVLYVTGYAEQMEMLGTGNEECLAKPFSMDVLLRRVRRMLDQPEFLTRKECEPRLAVFCA